MAGLAAAGVPWTDIRVVDSTGSTNTDLVAAVRSGAAGWGAVVAAGEQTAGRGRLERVWLSDPGTTLSVSAALAAPPQSVGFVPILTAVAVVRALAALGAPEDTDLKWPNDVMIAGRKAAGILAEAVPGGAVVGCGINVSIPEADLPVPEATSLAVEGMQVDRTDLLVAVLVELHRVYQRWADAGCDARASGLLEEYRSRCGTLGRDVRVQLPDGTAVSGRAVEVDAEGRLVVAGPLGESALTVGDVVHVRH